jgi:hypothetical protein
MSQYERRRRSNVLSGDGSRLPNGGNTRVGQRGSGHLAAFSVCLGGRLDKTGTHANDGSRGEAVGKPGVAGVYTNQRLNLSKPWEDLRMTSQGFKPGSGNPTVRHYRGALGNLRHGETETPSCNRKSGSGNPSPTAGRAQFLSQPSASYEARSAPRSYPTGRGADAFGKAARDPLGRSGLSPLLLRPVAFRTWPPTMVPLPRLERCLRGHWRGELLSHCVACRLATRHLAWRATPEREENPPSGQSARLFETRRRHCRRARLKAARHDVR